jgi:hypothetical protein
MKGVSDLTCHLACRIMGKTTQKVKRRRTSMLSLRMKAQNLKWKTKVMKIGQITMKSLEKVTMRMLSNLSKT